jgi:hypothetical protein
MRLLIVGPDIRDLSKVKNFTGIQAYYLARELRARGVELVFVKHKHPQPLDYLAGLEGYGADHVLAFGLRWFTHQPPGCAAILKAKVPGAVTQLHDGVVHKYLDGHMQGVDCTFTFRDDSTRYKDWERFAPRNHYIGWASDPEVLFPGQSGKHLRILIDHPYYKHGQPDITAAVTQDVMLFQAEAKRQRVPVSVRRLINGGAEEVTELDVQTKVFDRQHVPFPEIAKEYRQAHIYMVTHKESVGLTALECGFCGALTVATKGLIYPDRLQTIRHVEYEGLRAPWPKVLDSIDIPASVAKAREQSWDKVADRMLTWFGSYK